jgi:linoleoyl-CoA desaturase
VPIICVGFQTWIVGYVVFNVVTGIVLSYVFQLAHAVEGPEFDSVGLEDKMIETEWAVHQIKTTANFATSNKFISWL